MKKLKWSVSRLMLLLVLTSLGFSSKGEIAQARLGQGQLQQPNREPQGLLPGSPAWKYQCNHTESINSTGNHDCNQSIDIAQVEDTVLLCRGRAFQQMVSPPNIKFFGRIICNIGTPQLIRLQLFQRNVNYTQWRLVETKEFRCPSSNQVCVTPNYIYRIDRTKFVQVRMEMVNNSIDGQISVKGGRQSTYVYNDRGEPYPRYRVSTKIFRQGYVPFPTLTSGRSYDKCDDYPSRTTPPPCPRDARLTDRLLIEYRQRNWPLPPGRVNDLEGHHIKTLRWGGGNSLSNGVLLPSAEHDKFTRWWTGFSSRRW